jgi:hypothetical protein
MLALLGRELDRVRRSRPGPFLEVAALYLDRAHTGDLHRAGPRRVAGEHLADGAIADRVLQREDGVGAAAQQRRGGLGAILVVTAGVRHLPFDRTSMAL